MKETFVRLYRTDLISVQENNDCNKCVIYKRSAKNGQWMAMAIAVGKNKKEALLNYMESGVANTDKLEMWFDKYLTIREMNDKYGHHKKRSEMSFKTYNLAMGNWIRKCVSEDLLEELLLTDINTIVDWKNIAPINDDIIISQAPSNFMIGDDF